MDRPAGVINGKGYWQVHVRYKSYLAHRLAWLLHYGEWPTKQIDHINGIRGDNRIVNLREATLEQQRANSRGWSKRGMLKGVQQHGPSFQAHFRKKALGTYPTAELASAAYMAAATLAFGEFSFSGDRKS